MCLQQPTQAASAVSGQPRRENLNALAAANAGGQRSQRSAQTFTFAQLIRRLKEAEEAEKIDFNTDRSRTGTESPYDG